MSLGRARDFAAEEKAKQVEEEPEWGEKRRQVEPAGAGQCEGDKEYRYEAQQGDCLAGRGPHSEGRIARLRVDRRY